MEKSNSKLTNGQLLRRLKNAVVHIDKDKSYQSVYWSDKGLRLETTDDYAVISTNFHRHVFDKVTASGYSRPYLYTMQVIEIANENLKDIVVDGGYSFQRLLEVLKAKEDKSEYNIVTYYGWWCSVIFDGLYSISEGAVSSWLVYFKYINIIATNSIILEEHNEGLTNKQFAEKHAKLMEEFLKDIEEVQIFAPMSDEERMKQEVEALQEEELNNINQ